MGINATIDSKKYNGIETIEVGGKSIDLEQTFTGTKTITSNGTYIVSGYANAVVNVPTESGTSFTLQEKTVTANGEVTPDNGYDGLSKVIVNVAETSGGGIDYNEQRMLGYTYEYNNSTITSVVGSALKNDIFIKKCVLPNCESLGDESFYGCSSLESVEMPNLKTLGRGAFQNCKVLKEAMFPLLNESALTSNHFSNDSLLEKVDLGKTKSLPASCFANCSALKIVVLRGVNIVCALGNVNNFTGTPIESGTGNILVPRKFIENYKTANNWSTFYANNENLFVALEDYTVDGTTTGELDETKIVTLLGV